MKRNYTMESVLLCMLIDKTTYKQSDIQDLVDQYVIAVGDTPYKDVQKFVRDLTKIGKYFKSVEGRGMYYFDKSYDVQTNYGNEFTPQQKIEIRKRDVFCQLCASDIVGNSCGIDHIIPISLGGDNSLENGQLVCVRCNNLKSNKKTSKEVIETNLKELKERTERLTKINKSCIINIEKE